MLETLLLKVSPFRHDASRLLLLAVLCNEKPFFSSRPSNQSVISKSTSPTDIIVPTMSDHCAPVLIWPWHWPRLQRTTNEGPSRIRTWRHWAHAISPLLVKSTVGRTSRKIEAGWNGRKTPRSSTSFKKEGLSLTLTPQLECYQKIYCDGSNSFTLETLINMNDLFSLWKAFELRRKLKCEN